MTRQEFFDTVKAKRNPLLIILLLLIICLAIWYFFFNSKEDKNLITLYGNVDIRQVSLAFNSNERIAAMYVEEGDVVEKDQLLAILDTQNMLLQLDVTREQAEAQRQALLKLQNGSRPEEIAQYRAQVNSAQADAEYAEHQLQRLQSAYTNSQGLSVSRQDLDNAQANLKANQANLTYAQQALRLAEIGPRKEDVDEAEAQLKTLQAQVAIQQYNVEQAELKAPMRAVVRSRLLEPGDMASPQKPVYLLALDNPKWIRAYIQETQLGLIKPGMQADIYIDSYPDQAITGQIGYISSVAEFTPKNVQTEELRTSLLYEIRIFVQDQENKLRMGMPATVKIRLQPGQEKK